MEPLSAQSGVRLLFDENLAARLVEEVSLAYPNSAHLQTLGLMGATDRIIWSKAAEGGYVLVTKDEDFHRMSVLLGPPPKVVWIRLGNCSTQDVAEQLLAQAPRVRAFVEEPDIAFLALGRVQAQ